MRGNLDSHSKATYLRGLRTSLRGNAAAYGYSVMVSGSLTVLSGALGTPSVSDVFLFALGAVAAFASTEALVTRGFRRRSTGDPSDVVVLGSAFSFFSVGLGLGAAALVGQVTDGPSAWPLGSFLSTLAYLGMLALELSIAALVERQGKAEA